MDACQKCTEGPKGLGGHEDLFTHAFSGSDVVLKCRTCGSMWTRKYGDGTTFAWLSALVSEGALLPQR